MAWSHYLRHKYSTSLRDNSKDRLASDTTSQAEVDMIERVVEAGLVQESDLRSYYLQGDDEAKDRILEGFKNAHTILDDDPK